MDNIRIPKGKRNTMDNALDMTEAKEKLRNIRIYVDGLDNYTIALCALLADTLNHSLVPWGFINAYEHLLYNLERCFDTTTQQIIRNELAGLPPFTYAVMRGDIPKIADGIFPAEFANEVRVNYQRAQELAKNL